MQAFFGCHCAQAGGCAGVLQGGKFECPVWVPAFCLLRIEALGKAVVPLLETVCVISSSMMVRCMPTLSGKEGVVCDSGLGFKEGRGGSNLGRKPGSMRLASR